MVFVPPHTNTVVFIDNYHANYGGPGYNYTTGKQSTTSWLYPGTSISVFGTEYNFSTNSIRPLKPISDTFFSAGMIFPNGTLVNVAGAEAGVSGVAESLKRFALTLRGPVLWEYVLGTGLSRSPDCRFIAGTPLLRQWYV